MVVIKENLFVDRMLRALLSALCFYHLIALGFYAYAFRSESSPGMLSLDGSLNFQISVIHLLLFFLFAIRAIFWFEKNLFEVFVGQMGNLGVLGIYVWWFFEKYSFLKVVYGLKPDSMEYQAWIPELGVFRGGGNLEVGAFVVSILVIAYTLVRLGQTRRFQKAGINVEET